MALAAANGLLFRKVSYLWLLPLATVSGKIPVFESASVDGQKNNAQVELIEE